MDKELSKEKKIYFKSKIESIEKMSDEELSLLKNEIYESEDIREIFEYIMDEFIEWNKDPDEKLMELLTYLRTKNSVGNYIKSIEKETSCIEKEKRQKEIDKKYENELIVDLKNLFKDTKYSFEIDGDDDEYEIRFFYDDNKLTYINYYEEINESILALYFHSNFPFANEKIENLKQMLYDKFDLSRDTMEIENNVKII